MRLRSRWSQSRPPPILDLTATMRSEDLSDNACGEANAPKLPRSASQLAPRCARVARRGPARRCRDARRDCRLGAARSRGGDARGRQRPDRGIGDRRVHRGRARRGGAGRARRRPAARGDVRNQRPAGGRRGTHVRRHGSGVRARAGGSASAPRSPRRARRSSASGRSRSPRCSTVPARGRRWS